MTTSENRAETVAEIVADAREWVAFTDGEGDTWQFDLSFMLSNYECIYGNGCLGIDAEPAPEMAVGCCMHGAHFGDVNDEADVLQHARRLTSAQWQHHTSDEDRWFVDGESGVRATATIDGACRFLNRPDFEGGPGCALHIGAEEASERPLDWKPDVCWQVPLRLDEHIDDNGHHTWWLRSWERRDWGEGGTEMHWWCTEDDRAFVGNVATYLTMRDEIVEMVGEDAYAMLVQHIDRVGASRFARHPSSVPVELKETSR
jgi:hypothetical protein